MVSTRSRAGIVKHTEAAPTMPTSTTPDLAAILEGQSKMQQELADLKKRNAEEMEALRQENSRLRRKIEVDPTQKGKGKESSEDPRSPAYQPNEEESEYNPTPHTFTTTQQTPIISTLHTTILAPPTTNHNATTHPTTHIPPLTTTPPRSLPSSNIPSHTTHYHHTHPSVVTLSLTPSQPHVSLASRNPSHWTATQEKLTPTSISRCTSPMFPSTHQTTLSSAKPSPPPSKALLPLNVSPPSPILN